MQWSSKVEKYLHRLKPLKKSSELIERIVPLIDLTYLDEHAKEEEVAILCENAETPFGHVASVCSYPKFVSLLATQFANKPIRVGTVANFPRGEDTLETVLIEIGRALEEGTQEIDVVFPYKNYLKNDREFANHFVTACKAACGDKILKVILETGALSTEEMIAQASFDALSSGADFIKTSTGKIPQGPTLLAAGIMLLAIRDIGKGGFKVSGGIREFDQAIQYIELADQMMGRDWVSAKNFRIGSSKLLEHLMKG